MNGAVWDEAAVCWAPGSLVHVSGAGHPTVTPAGSGFGVSWEEVEEAREAWTGWVGVMRDRAEARVCEAGRWVALDEAWCVRHAGEWRDDVCWGVGMQEGGGRDRDSGDRANEGR